jgi:1-acyl-sn-glycerol-3-phosphate acyltransferase
VKSWCYLVCRALGHGLSWPFVRLQVWRAPGAGEAAGATVLVANHISHFDPLFLAIAFDRTIDWMTTEEFYANPLAAAWLRAVNTFPVDRSRPDRRALRVGVERLRAERMVGVFPEGGIRAGATSILEGAAPKSGAMVLARLAGAPIVPCVVLGTDRLYATRSWWPGPPRTPVWVTIGAPFAVSDMKSDEANARMAIALRELAAAAVAHFDLRPDDLPTTPQHRKGRDAQATA